MADAIDPQTKDGINMVNAKNLGEMPAQVSNLLLTGIVRDQIRGQENATSVQQLANQNAVSMNTMLMAVIANKLINMDVEEAIAAVKATTGSDIAQLVGNLSAALSSGRTDIKGEGNVPPVTP